MCVYVCVTATGGAGCEGGRLRPLPLHSHGPERRGFEEGGREGRARHAGEPIISSLKASWSQVTAISVP